MASRIKVVFRRQAFAEIRTLPAVARELDERAEKIAESAGDGYVVDPARETGGKIRDRSAVLTGDWDAMHDNAKNHTLLRSVDAGRG